MKLRQMLKERLRRGHVDITLSMERLGETELRVNEDLLGAALAAFRAAASRHGLSSQPDLNLLLRLPGVMSTQTVTAAIDGPAMESAVLEGAADLIDRLQTARAEEGSALAAELGASTVRLRAISEEIGVLRASVRGNQHDRLQSRLTRLLEGVEVDPDRVLVEAALLAERSDIEEENVRLLAHVERFTAMLAEGGELGKRLDFLLQELNREANTMLSKTGAAAGDPGLRITELGLALKTELERAREQVQNIE